MKLMKMIVTAFVVTSAYTAQAAKIHVKNVDAKDRLGNSISTVYLDYSVQCGPSGYYGERVAVKNGVKRLRWITIIAILQDCVSMIKNWR